MVREQVQIKAPLPLVFEAFADLKHWLAALPDVLNVNVLYDDGAHQEFLMTVARPNGPETIRGIRYVNRPNTLELFQPVPPPGFRKMSGTWRFTSTGDTTTVEASRIFEVIDGSVTTHNAVADKLRGYLQTNLGLFRDYIESGAIRA